MKKNVVLWEIERDGYATFLIASFDNGLDEFFNDWAYSLAKKHTFNTVKGYCHAVAGFLDYILEVSLINNGLTPSLMIRAIDAFESYLVFASASDDDIARQAAINLAATKKSGVSLTPIFAGVNHFIDASENFRRSMQQLEADGYIDSNMASNTPLFESGRRDINQVVASKIKANSWLAGCIYGGAKTLKKRGLVTSNPTSSVVLSNSFGGDEKTFPIDKAKELIAAAKTYRDKTLWSLIAATGCRITEALTITLDDIVPEERKIFIVPVESRRHLLRRYFTEAELKKISHKGRNKPDTFPIRPFDQLFWMNLDLYMEHEYKSGVSHRFLFQKQTRTAGDPYIKSYRGALELFHKASLKASGEKYGFHSLRHMYGYYLKNWCPNGKGWGLPLDEVKVYMGHDNINSTKRYARDDIMKLQAALSYANALHDQGRFTTVVDARIEMLEQQIEKLKKISETEAVKRLEVMDED